MDEELESSVKILAEGFSSLAEEYRTLAQQHELLERKLSAATLQIESLRSLLPSEKERFSTDATAKEPVDLPKVSSTRNLDTWLQYMLDKGIVKDRDSLSVIHRAQITKFKLSARQRPERKRSRRCEGLAPRGSRSQSRATSQPPIIEVEEPPMEQDFTEFNTPGELGCPFADRRRSEKFGEHASVAQRSRDLPTPQGSVSYTLGQSGRQSKRASFVDPLRPDIKQPDPMSPALSAVDSAGIACPIRFLNDHNPEDIAKYFEEHKHELPRSHELCVRRFQSNSDTMRELDEKYGNIVTMIQGLGKKHQPMLPEVPNADATAEGSDEQQTKSRVKNWAASVNEFAGQTGNGSPPPDGSPEPNEPDDAPVDAESDERTSHFDRPLKEIRVGESPSRPWGVTIPARYLDRDDDISAVSSSPVAAAASVSPPTRPKATEPDALPQAQDERVLAAIMANRLHNIPIVAISAKPATPASTDQQQAPGKCPFDHKALLRPTTEPSSVKVEHSSSTTATAPDPHSTAAHPEPASAAAATRQRPEPQLINHGIAVVADRSQLPEERFVNNGLLILGFGRRDAGELMAAAPERYRIG